MTLTECSIYYLYKQRNVGTNSVVGAINFARHSLWHSKSFAMDCANRAVGPLAGLADGGRYDTSNPL